ncbi:MAG: glycerate kinase, partial [Dehalococcoidales bacterium]
WGLLGDNETAAIEMAAASGITLVPAGKLDPLLTTTYGTVELIRAALDHGCRKLIIGIGGSATNDGGAGMAQALGVQLLDSRGTAIPFGGAALSKLEHINITGQDPRLADCEILLACDVDNPLCGSDGASAIYGPQKGATPEMVARLDLALSHYADVIYRDIGTDVRDDPGAGAAGGLGMGLMVFLKAKVVPGIDIVIQSTGLAKDLMDADLVFTAEGRIDSQTAKGKTPVGVARKAKEFGLPVIALAGEVTDDYQAVYQQGIDAVFSIAPGPISLNQSMEQAEQLIANAAESAMRLFISRRN